jgi:hypothetical protein
MWEQPENQISRLQAPDLQVDQNFHYGMLRFAAP